MTTSLRAYNVGKLVGDHLYLHFSAVGLLPVDLRQMILEASRLAKVDSEKDFNVLKLHSQGEDLSLLSYPLFFEDPFPSLYRSWRVSLARNSVIYRNYEESRNPPILHRKELLLPKTDSRIVEFAKVTDAAEELGLFTDTSKIGFREQWYSMIAERGFQIVGSEFIPLANVTEKTVDFNIDELNIKRHLTALSRSNFSAPVQALIRHGLISRP